MSTRIRILEGIVPHIRIPVQTLRVAGTGHERVRADEPANQGIVVARVVIVQAQAVFPTLAGLPNGVSRRLRRGCNDSR